jgi:ubiquinone/menaquinone biosynthesis C-methylase UbiE
MNRVHRWLCASSYWKKTVETQIVPWVLNGVGLGSDVLEVGPGPGITTDLLRTRVPHLTCVEIDGQLAASLKSRMTGSNVTVLHEDATAMPFADASFDSAVCFTMLHHVPSAALQDLLLSEVARVLRPGAVFAGVDSRYSRSFGLLHLFDTMVVVDPLSFPGRLEAAGFRDIETEINPYAFRFRVRRQL